MSYNYLKSKKEEDKIIRKSMVLMLVLLFSVLNLFAGWARTYGGSFWDYGYSVQQTTDGEYIVVGNTDSYGVGGSDVYLIKTDENGVAVEEIIISSPSDFSYSIDKISNNNISLQFSLPQSSRIELNIYDAAGRYISTPIKGNCSEGSHSVNFEVGNSGVYFFNLRYDHSIENGKFIIF